MPAKNVFVKITSLGLDALAHIESWSSASCSVADGNITQTGGAIGIYERIKEAQRRQIVSQSDVVKESDEAGERGGRGRRAANESGFAPMKDLEIVSLGRNIGKCLIQDIN
jgi:hypothetical protein